MSQLRTARIVVGLCLASTLAACGGNTGKGTETATKSTEKATKEGCDTDYSDPQKVFCVTLPTGYKADPQIETSDLYAELIRFTGPDPADGISVSVGFTSSNFTTYEQELASDEELMKMTGRTVESSGTTKGEGGKWWIFTQDGIRTIAATAKATNGKPVNCTPSNTTPTPAAVEACKSIRPFATKS